MTSADPAAAPSEPSGETRPPAWRERIPGGLLIVLGVGIGLEATTFEVAFLADPVGPKALPYLVAVVLTLSGFHQVGRPQRGTRWPDRSGLVRMGLASTAFIAYALVLPWLGFLLSTTLVVAALSFLFGAAPRHGASAAAALAFALWLLFVWVLALPLPVGALWTR